MSCCREIEPPPRRPERLCKASVWSQATTFTPNLVPGGVASYIGCSCDDRASWIVRITLRYARKRTPVLRVLGDGQAADLAHQFVSAVGGIDRNRLRDAMLTDDEWPRLTAAVDELRTLPIVFAERMLLTTDANNDVGSQVAPHANADNLLVLDASCPSGRVEAEVRPIGRAGVAPA